MSVALAWAGGIWEGASAAPGQEPLRPGEVFTIASATKTVTAVLVLEAAAGGLLELDAPVPTGPGLPRPVGPLPTVRQLLTHTSGLVDHRELPGHRDSDPPTLVAGLERSLAADRARPPGTGAHYNSAGYLYLGLVLEHVTGRPYAQLVQDLARRIGLPSLGTDPTVPLGAATGGVRANQADLARFGLALLSDDTVLPPGWRDQMVALGDHNVGLGVWPTCPCGTTETGDKWATTYGHHIGDGGLYVWPGEMALVVKLARGDALSIERSLAIGEALRAVLAGTGDSPGDG